MSKVYLAYKEDGGIKLGKRLSGSVEDYVNCQGVKKYARDICEGEIITPCPPIMCSCGTGLFPCAGTLIRWGNTDGCFRFVVDEDV